MTDDDILTGLDEDQAEEPAATAEDLAEEAWAHLAMHPDAQLRYRAIDILESRLTHLRALTAKQLELELGGLSRAADALGVSRQAITELYARTDTPGPRADRDRADRPATAYGRWLALAGLAAELAGQGRRWDTLYRQASRTTTVYPAVAEAVPRWLRIAEREPRTAERAKRLRADLNATDPRVGDIGQRQLTQADEADAHLAGATVRTERRTSPA